mmetsp:Transcript_18238/g.54228  ORF Transcript_18238/g.54228 Transcript_18238/m.54228 type:complete len:215 (+) Transcript_18238:244-888(+)
MHLPSAPCETTRTAPSAGSSRSAAQLPTARSQRSGSGLAPDGVTYAGGSRRQSAQPSASAAAISVLSRPSQWCSSISRKSWRTVASGSGASAHAFSISASVSRARRIGEHHTRWILARSVRAMYAPKPAACCTPCAVRCDASSVPCIRPSALKFVSPWRASRKRRAVALGCIARAVAMRTRQRRAVIRQAQRLAQSLDFFYSVAGDRLKDCFEH